MSKITLNNVGSLVDVTTAALTINGNSTTIQTAFDNTLSRDGTAPNTMGASIDMNSNRVLNLPNPVSLLEPVRLTDLNTIIGGGTISTIPAGGSTNNVLKKNSGTNYDASWTGTPTFTTVTSGNFVGPGTGLTGTASALTAGSASTVVTNANLSGPITSAGNITSIASQTGTGSKFVVDTSPTITTPALANPVITGAAPATTGALGFTGGFPNWFDGSVIRTVVGVATAQAITNKQSVLVASPASGGIGYSTGAGGAVTQLTSRVTGVTLNTMSGAITLFTAAGSVTSAQFVVTNSNVAATDTIILSTRGGTNKYRAYVTNVSAGSFEISFETTVGTASDAPIFNFTILKGVSS